MQVHVSVETHSLLGFLQGGHLVPQKCFFLNQQLILEIMLVHEGQLYLFNRYIGFHSLGGP